MGTITDKQDWDAWDAYLRRIPGGCHILQSSQGVPEPADNQFVMDVFAREATRNPRDNEELSLGPFPVIQINDIVHASIEAWAKKLFVD